MLPTRLQRLPREKKLPSRNPQLCKTLSYPIWKTCSNQCQSIWAFSVKTTKALWFLRNWDAGWGKGSCYDIIEMVVSYSFAWFSFTGKTYYYYYHGPVAKVKNVFHLNRLYDSFARERRFCGCPDQFCNVLEMTRYLSCFFLLFNSGELWKWSRGVV